VFSALVGYRAVGLTPRAFLGYALYLPETALLVLMVVLASLGLPGRRGWVLFVVSFLPVLWVGLTPLTARSPGQVEMGVRLVSANLDSWSTDMSIAAQELASQNPDLLCLQEVWAPAHLDALRQVFPGFVFVPGGGAEQRAFDAAVFVGVPQELLVRSLPGSPGVAGAVVRVGEREIVVLSVHGLKERAYWPSSVASTVDQQLTQASEILQEVRGQGLPCLIGGDFNAPLSGPGLKLLRSRFRVASRQVAGGPVLTYPASFPLLEIDHILATFGLLARRYQAFPTGSDHQAVVAEF